MSDKILENAFDAIFKDTNDFEYLVAQRPRLAHYTSIQTLEKIMMHDELWFSNPLFMNDMEEVRFGVNQGWDLFDTSQEVEAAAGSEERTKILRDSFYHYYSEFGEKHALDVYVFCLSEHKLEQEDGLLSMWRGYGGQGTGAALVFNTDFILSDDPESPLRIGKVRYGSAKERISYLRGLLMQWCSIVKELNLPNDKLYIAAWNFFCAVKFYALVSKHHGFHEENEWRIIYMADYDDKKIFKDSLSYVVGERGVEPKLKFKIKPFDGHGGWTFSSILDRIILGPSASTQLAQLSVKRMLESVKKSDFCGKVTPSTIPLRAVPQR